ncbi:uncharacterized protein PV07_09009 [Cladophialophora immunda]|uniref:Uncharacterized protein n=1 Tax=Cladophialophora immunda TaxID=569365 RepID=A0A0D2C3T1_9EURO|nr:uncharacterized protein PV07_09009 [Cladophialophora immunda]KIW25873.1 hypothetical protein PV07_09009 [Cladophialophora immunda]OQV10426.1 hypothetical protein CLAIMM_14427 [Cladophialophora immunda]
MGGKARVMIAVHHRGKLSLGDNRKELGRSAYHWGILVQRKKPRGLDSNAYDATDGTLLDPLTGVDHNSNHDWRFRSKLGTEPMQSGQILVRITIGKVPPHITNARIEALLKAVPLPDKSATPRQSCVTWTMAAIEVMQKEGLAEAFDVNQFMDKALEVADEWIKNPVPGRIYNYTNRPQ